MRKHGWPRLDQASAENAHCKRYENFRLASASRVKVSCAHLVKLAWPVEGGEGDTCASSRSRMTVRRKTLSPALLASSRMTFLRL